jgi:AcrR family transcriptional regulator
MPAIPAPQPPTMRERYWAQVRGEVKQAALRQLAQSGPVGLSVSAIGKQLGVSAPTLYRYFTSRDELLTELVIDACNDLADALRAAAGQPAAQEPRPRFEALARAYRSWALARLHRYRLAIWEHGTWARWTSTTLLSASGSALPARRAATGTA